MKIRILFVIDSIRIGGIQSALINLLNVIDYNKYDVSLFAFYIDYTMAHMIPRDVHVLKTNSLLKLMNTPSQDVKKDNSCKYFLRKAIAVLCKLFSANRIYSIAFKTLDPNMKNYDYAISFTNNGNPRSVYFGSNKYVLENVKADKKFSWIHGEYNKLQLNNDINNNEYKKFDGIICVSNSVKKSFISCIPELSHITDVIYNIVDIEMIKKLSKESVPSKYFDKLCIVTVARLDANKNVTMCLEIAKKLRESGCIFNWIILGDGPEKKQLKEKCRELELEGIVHFLGYITNPYPYVAGADLFVSTSLTESFGLAIYESLILGVPVIAKEYDAVHEVISDHIDGIIVNGGACEMAAVIKPFIDNLRSLDNFHKDCKEYQNRNIRAYEKFETIFN